MLAVPALFAGGLSKKFKNWDRSPQAYFLTASERAGWKVVKTDDDAQRSILAYLARRGPGFRDLLVERTAAADRYFSSAEAKGSETLLGKVVILFGPPSSLERKTGSKGTSVGDPGRVQGAGGGRGKDVGGSVSTSPFSGPLGSHGSPDQSPLIALVYDGAQVPMAIGKPFRVELKVTSNANQEAVDPKDLDAKFETMARASVTAPEPAKP